MVSLRKENSKLREENSRLREENLSLKEESPHQLTQQLSMAESKLTKVGGRKKLGGGRGGEG